MRSSRSNNAAVVEELLRIGGLARSVSRVAREDVEIGGARIRTGQHVELRLDEANHDSSRFSQPDLFCPSRGPTRHVALGAGAHACPGAALIRMAAAVTTRGLLRRFHSFTPVEQKWRGGSGFRWPEPLCVVLE
ncbi:MAG: cytochrome P450 [Acidobacteriales bacterium]|nr:cytochrome P450 [Terriglobales bacterium]